MVTARRVADALLADRGHVAYEVADPSHADNVMTVRDKVGGPRRVVPRDTWRFARLEAGKVVADSTHVYLEGGFEPHRLYDIVYRGTEPDRGRAWSGSGTRHDVVAQVWQSRGAVDPDRVDHEGGRVRCLAERTVPSHLSLLRIQRR